MAGKVWNFKDISLNINLLTIKKSCFLQIDTNNWINKDKMSLSLYKSLVKSFL
ncbi:hypothetical protein CPIN17261_0765 [Campylobacter pinnipediorum subsp. pinnipediorum]|nr:hypothetical protein CPIN17260_0858 [Campylobacter pinnipediorum subsp. pinnipediorum]AQW82778.1 hypothetical protein CPIN17261_0765 [Campylobacter pinnipediorum subsp. pinnipediorum]AQW84465.1 hypothetical protein CPIN17262_0779 [Campylobacter pinnipediorum subsp. pinnipediorum]